MGTRRSKHNKGRKPLYKDHREVASNILAVKRYGDFPYKWHDSNLDWRSLDQFKLGILCEANSDVEQSADALGRKPTAIAHRARELGIVLPPQWSKLISTYVPRPRKPRAVRQPVARRVALSYPFIAKPRDEHGDLLAVNALIPAGIPDHMRADICQEVMLAIYEGRTTLDALRARKGTATYYIRKFWHDNYEAGGHAISFNNADEDWNSDAVASSIAAKEWHAEQFTDRTRYAGHVRTFTPPTQFEAAWRDQIGRLQLKQHELGQFLSLDEVERMLEEL